MRNYTSQFKQSLTAAAFFCGLVMPALSHAEDYYADPVPAPTSTPAPAPAETTISIKLVQAKMASRDLVLDHIFWARGVVLSLLAKNQGVYQTAVQMSEENAKSIGKFVEPYCGAEKAQQLVVLLSEHNAGIVRYANATVSEVPAEIEASEKFLYENSQKISTLLSEQNEFVKKEQILEIFNMHVQQHIDQIKLLKAGDSDKEARLWVEMKTHIYQLSDMLVDAMAKKYPDKF